MFDRLLSNPASILKGAVIAHFKRTVGLWIFVGICICIALTIRTGVGGLLFGLVVAVVLVIATCGRLYIKTLETLAQLESYENIASIENDTSYLRARACDQYAPEPDMDAKDAKVCESCGRRYDSKLHKCPLCNHINLNSRTKISPMGSTRKCKACGKENAIYSSYCVACGTPL